MAGFNLTTIAPFANAQLIKNEMIDSVMKLSLIIDCSVMKIASLVIIIINNLLQTFWKNIYK